MATTTIVDGQEDQTDRRQLEDIYARFKAAAEKAQREQEDIVHQLDAAGGQLLDWLNAGVEVPVTAILLAVQGLDLAGLGTDKKRIWLWTYYLDIAHRMELRRLIEESSARLEQGEQPSQAQS